MLIGVPLAPRVAEVLLDPFPPPPRIAMPSALGKLVMVLLLTVPVVRCAVVPAEPCMSARMAVPSETAEDVELVRVLPVIVRLLMVPVPFSIWMPCRRALVRVLLVIVTVPLTEVLVNAPASLNAMLLSSY